MMMKCPAPSTAVNQMGPANPTPLLVAATVPLCTTNDPTSCENEIVVASISIKINVWLGGAGPSPLTRAVIFTTNSHEVESRVKTMLGRNRSRRKLTRSRKYASEVLITPFRSASMLDSWKGSWAGTLLGSTSIVSTYTWV